LSEISISVLMVFVSKLCNCFPLHSAK